MEYFKRCFSFISNSGFIVVEILICLLFLLSFLLSLSACYGGLGRLTAENKDILGYAMQLYYSAVASYYTYAFSLLLYLFYRIYVNNINIVTGNAPFTLALISGVFIPYWILIDVVSKFCNR